MEGIVKLREDISCERHLEENQNLSVDIFRNHDRNERSAPKCAAGGPNLTIRIYTPFCSPKPESALKGTKPRLELLMATLRVLRQLYTYPEPIKYRRRRGKNTV